MTRKLSLSTLLLLAVLPLGAIAAEPAQQPARVAPTEEAAPLFLQLDTNHDGYVTKEEAKRSAEVTARFNELDADHDGRISAAEFKRGMQASL